MRGDRKAMICVCIGKPNYDVCKELLAGVELAEIRLEGVELSPGEIRQIFSLPGQLIATCRPTPDTRTEEERKKVLLTAVEAGAAYVDLEIEADPAFKEEIMDTARIKGSRVILSYHNFEHTPPKEQMDQIIRQCFTEGADIAKIVCLVHTGFDSARMLSLYENPGRLYQGRIIALGMGEKGKITRVAAPLLGAPFTYASPAEGRETAPGQMDRETLEKILRVLK